MYTFTCIILHWGLADTYDMSVPCLLSFYFVKPNSAWQACIDIWLLYVLEMVWTRLNRPGEQRNSTPYSHPIHVKLGCRQIHRIPSVFRLVYIIAFALYATWHFGSGRLPSKRAGYNAPQIQSGENTFNTDSDVFYIFPKRRTEASYNAKLIFLSLRFAKIFHSQTEICRHLNEMMM